MADLTHRPARPDRPMPRSTPRPSRQGRGCSPARRLHPAPEPVDRARRSCGLSDGPTGVRGLKFSGGRTVALFPNATLLASAWSEDTAYEVGRCSPRRRWRSRSTSCSGPTINLHRSLLGGRLFEAYSEDPLLTGKLAAAYVRGPAGQRRRRLPQAPGRQRVRDRPQHR